MPYNTYTQPATSSPPTTTGCGCGCGGCPTCHSLQCLCRPRFFAGQLVTDADFRRLDDYLVGKARLHNRYLHGTGVVCGLEAVCNPCDDTVTVRDDLEWARHPTVAPDPQLEELRARHR